MRHGTRIAALERSIPKPLTAMVLVWPDRSVPFEHDHEKETEIAWNPLQRQHEEARAEAEAERIKAEGGYLTKRFERKPGAHMLMCIRTGGSIESMQGWAAMLRDFGVFDEAKYALEVGRAREWAEANGWEYEPDVEPVTTTVDK